MFFTLCGSDHSRIAPLPEPVYTWLFAYSSCVIVAVSLSATVSSSPDSSPNTFTCFWPAVEHVTRVEQRLVDAPIVRVDGGRRRFSMRMS